MPITDQNISDHRYSVTPRTLIFLTCDNNILLLRGAEYKSTWPGLYNGVGGHIEQGEDVFSGASRELTEETGYTDIDLTLRGVITINTSKSNGILIFVFHGYVDTMVIRESREGVLEWVDLSKVYNLPLVEDIPIILSHIINPVQQARIFYAIYEYDDEGDLRINIT